MLTKKSPCNFSSKLGSFFLFLSLTCIPLQSYAEPFAEYYLLKKYKNSVQKNSAGYLVTYKSGEEVQLKNCIIESCSDSWARYSIEDVINDRYFVFYVAGYEWASYETHDVKLGTTIKTSGFPKFSPNLKRIASVNADEMNGSSINIYEIQNNEFKNVFKPETNEFNLPEFYSWNGNDQVRVKDDKYQNNVVNMVISFDEDSKKWSYKKTTEPFPLKNPKTDEENFINKFPDIMTSFSDKKLALSLLKEGANAAYLDKKLLDDEEVMTAALKSNCTNGEYLSPRLKDDLNFMNFAIEQVESTFQFASLKLRGDRNVVIKALNAKNTPYKCRTNVIDIKGKVLSFASDELRDDEELIRIAITNNDEEFRYASKRIKDKTVSNLDFAKSLVALNCRVFAHLSEKLRDNEDLLWAADNGGKCSSSTPWKTASKRLKDNIYVVKKIVLQHPKFAAFYLEEASEPIKNDKKFLLMLAKEGAVIGYVAKKFEDDKEFTQEITRMNELNKK